MDLSRRVAALAAALACLLSACQDLGTAPSEVVTVSISVVQYIRTRPLVGESTTKPVLTLWYALVPGDPYGRTSPRQCVLNPAGSDTFTCDRRFDGVPVDRDCGIYVLDPGVSPLYVARDLYVNGTKVTRVETLSSGQENGLFRIDARGRVY